MGAVGYFAVVQVCKVCGNNFTHHCTVCRDLYMSGLRDPKVMTAEERAAEVHFYRTRPEIIDFFDLQERIKELVGRPFSTPTPRVGALITMSDLDAWFDESEVLPPPDDLPAWAALAQQAFNAYS